MFTAQVYKVQIVCLSGIMEEVYTVQEVIRKYNREKAERTGKMFQLLADSTIAIDADVVIGIVGNYIEKAEVIEESVKAGKKVLLFFSRYQDPKNTIPGEGKAVEEFKEKMSQRCCCVEYNGIADFKAALVKCAQIIDL